MNAPDAPVRRARDKAANAQQRAEFESERADRAPERLSHAQQEAEDAPDEPSKAAEREMRTHARAARVQDDAARAQVRAIRLNEERIAHVEQQQAEQRRLVAPGSATTSGRLERRSPPQTRSVDQFGASPSASSRRARPRAWILSAERT